jgi:hypothetical protein
MGGGDIPPVAKTEFNAALDYIDKVKVSSRKATIQTTYPQAPKRISGNILLC